jgi:hypothetical protein
LHKTRNPRLTGFQRNHVGAVLGFGQRKGAENFTGRHPWQILGLLLFGAESASDPTTTVTAHPPPPTGGCDEPRSSRPTRGSTAPAGTPPSRRQVLPGPVTMAAATPIVEDAPRSGSLVVERPSRGARWLPEWWPAGGASRTPPDRRTTRRSTCSVGRCSTTARRQSWPTRQRGSAVMTRAPTCVNPPAPQGLSDRWRSRQRRGPAMPSGRSGGPIEM